MNEKLKEWRASGKYLPFLLRDFHNQKNIFKALHRFVNVEGHSYCKDISWVSGQCYIIDIFLWYMARKGYTLQKSRQKLEFEDINEDFDLMKKESIEIFSSFPKENKK